MAESEYRCVFWTGSAGVAAVAKSLLQGECIDYFLKNEGGYGSITSFNFVTGPVEFWVRADDEDRAREFLRDLSPADR